jgi:DNA-binding NarL/FixJ family response regulator
MYDGPSPVPSLYGASVLAVVPDSTHALAVGAILASAGAQVRVVRSVAAAREAIEGELGGFDAAMIDDQLGEPDIAAVIERLAAHALPCLYAMFGDAAGPHRGAFECVPLASGREALVAATAQVVQATAQARRARAIEPPPHSIAIERAPLLHPVPRVEQAIDELAEHRRLSPRERIVLRYIALGYKYGEIGRELAISLSTVKMHVTNVRRKVGAGTRGELMRKMFAA